MKRGTQRRGSVDADGVRIVRTPGRWPMIIAVGLAALVVIVIMIRLALRLDEPEVTLVHDAPAHPERRQHTTRRQIPAPVARGPRLTAVKRAAAPALPVSVATPTPAPEPAAGTDAPEQAPTPPPSDYGWDGPTGIGLFPPPGTNPPKPGIVVPDDFELPPGYVRYHQTTDDGRSLAPILTFHPDYEFVDEDGNPVEVPEDLVVPPEMAPAGLPLEILEVPETVYPEGPSQEEIERILAEHPELLEESADLPSEESDSVRAEHSKPSADSDPSQQAEPIPAGSDKERFAETLR